MGGAGATVSGDDGLDELTTTGHSRVWEISRGDVHEHNLDPRDLGIPLADISELIGGSPARFAPYVDLYRRAAAQLGTTAHPVGMHSHGFVADTDQEAVDTVWPHYKRNRDRLGAERGWPPVTRESFEDEVAHGSLYIGSPETVAQRIAAAMRAIDARRFDMVYTSGSTPVDARLGAVELYGREVAPRVRELVSDLTEGDAAAADRTPGETDGTTSEGGDA